MKEIRLEVPVGCVIDKENSTFECIKLKEISLPFLGKKVFAGSKTKEVQEKLFKFRCKWNSGEQTVQNYPFLFINKLGIITGVYESQYRYYQRHKLPEIYLDEILNYKID